MKLRTALTAACIVTGLLGAQLTGCAKENKVTIEVHVRISTCVENGANCFALGVPEAKVVLVSAGDLTIAEGSTDETGKVRLTADPLGQQARIAATSPLIEGGRREAEVMLPTEPSMVSVTINGQLVTDPPARG